LGVLEAFLGQAVGGELDLMEKLVGAEERAAAFRRISLYFSVTTWNLPFFFSVEGN
jgi:hypothetical protein